MLSGVGDMSSRKRPEKISACFRLVNNDMGMNVWHFCLKTKATHTDFRLFLCVDIACDGGKLWKLSSICMWTLEGLF